MSTDNGDDDRNDSHIMSFVKSAIHKNVDNMRTAGRAPFSSGMPETFSRRQSAAPTCVILMSCRAWNEDDGKSTRKACAARTLLRQTSIDITEEYPNILWDTNGPPQFRNNTDCIRRLCDRQQILTLDAHGSTEIVKPKMEDYFQNQSNVFWVFPAVTGLSLSSEQYARALRALDILWGGRLRKERGGVYNNPEQAWMDFLMGPQDPNINEVKRALQKITYPADSRGDRSETTECPGVLRGSEGDLEASLLSWRVYRPGDLMPVQSYSFWTHYNAGNFFRSGINTLANILLTNKALNQRQDEGASSKSAALREPGVINNFWEIFERREMKNVGGVNTLPLVPEVTFSRNGQVNSIKFKLYHLGGEIYPGLNLKNLTRSRSGEKLTSVKTALEGKGGWILNGSTNMKIFTGLCLPSLIDKIPVDMQFSGGVLTNIMHNTGYNVSLPAKKNPSFFDMFRTQTGDEWRAKVTQTCFHCKEPLGEQIKSNHYCNFCGRNMKRKQAIFRCNKHDYDICQQCHRQYQQRDAAPPPPRESKQQTHGYGGTSRQEAESWHLPADDGTGERESKQPPPSVAPTGHGGTAWHLPATSLQWKLARANPNLANPNLVQNLAFYNSFGGIVDILRQNVVIQVRQSTNHPTMWAIREKDGSGQWMYIPKVVQVNNSSTPTLFSGTFFDQPLRGGGKRKTRRKKNKRKRKTRRKKKRRKKKTRGKKNKRKRKTRREK